MDNDSKVGYSNKRGKSHRSHLAEILKMWLLASGPDPSVMLFM